jgi:hypothetical protein
MPPATLEELDQTAGQYCAQASADEELLGSFIVQSELPLDWIDG